MSTEDDDIEELKEVTEAAAPPLRIKAKLPGPGLGESLLWILGFMVIQFGFAIAVAVGLVIWSGETNPSAIDQKVRDELGQDGAAVINLLPNFLILLIVLPAAAWRLRPEALRKMNFAAPSSTQIVILLATTASLGLFGNYVQVLIQAPFVRFLELNSPKTLDLVERHMQFFLDVGKASVWILLFFMAVVPAVGEEFLFRGLIGRGLVARWGMVLGVALTSLMFACVHLYPPQVVALIPLAIFMHVAYLATRSFWAPLLVHFFNNALAGVMLHYGPMPEDPLAVTPMETVHWILMILSALFSIFGFMALWSVKTEYVGENGDIAEPRYPTVERPPNQLGFKRVAPTNVPLMLAFTGLLIAESYVFWRELKAEPPAEPAKAVLLESSFSHPSSLQASHVTLSS